MSPTKEQVAQLTRMRRRVEEAKKTERYTRREIDAAVGAYGLACIETTTAEDALVRFKARMQAEGIELL